MLKKSVFQSRIRLSISNGEKGMKKIWLKIAAVLAVTGLLFGCTGKKAGASFFDLKGGMVPSEIETVLGNEYERTEGPIRMIYHNVSLIDSVTNEKETKLSCFLADDGKCYLYAYYIYGPAKADYEKIKQIFTEKLGESSPGEEANTIQWSSGNSTYTLTDAGSYLAVGAF